jgi:FkbM family methyltransferase
MPTLARSPLLRPARDRVGRWLHARIDAVATQRIQSELAADRDRRLRVPRRWGPEERLRIAETAVLNDALLNTVSGTITVEEYAFLGHDVALLTGTHDIGRVGLERQRTVPSQGRDIVIGPGAWLASRAVVVGPCRIGTDAVIAAGAVVNADVPARAIVAGNPARLVGRVGEGDSFPDAVSLLTEVGTLFAHAHDRVITPYIRAHGSWDPDDCRLLEAELAPGSVAVDVGANIGYMTLVAARAVGPAGTVIAVEPHPDNVLLLRANVIRNDVAERVRIVAAAAWSSNGSVDLAECIENTGDHRIQTLQADRATLTVKAVRLDEIVPANLHVNVIKLDTQATEHRALEGATAIIARDRPIILCEYWPQGLRERGDDPLAVLDAFRRLGYVLEVPDDPEIARLDDTDFIAAIHSRPGSFGGFATLRLHPQA